ncbi:MAG TPA: hypothetical protein VJS40_02080 [Aestuariivirgaceae bacterium]|nr:hypothetical protein [Aestuariivirgaceae bacterium]
MSELETIMLVALGFAIAALIALFLGRYTWRFALGLGKRHMQRAAPSTLAELKADRDRLRAEYAMLSRKLDLRLTDLKTRLAEQMAEVSRNRNRIDHLQAELRARDATIAEREGELVTLKMQLGPLESELAARTEATQQLKEILRRRDAEIARHQQLAEQLRAELAHRDRHIAASDGARARNEAGNAMFDPQSLSLQERVGRRLDDLAALASNLSARRAELSRELEAAAALKDDIAAAAPTAEEHLEPLTGEILGPTATDPAPEIFEDSRLAELDDGARSLEDELAAAVRETDALAHDLRDLDARFHADLATIDVRTGTDPAGAHAEPPPPPPPRVAEPGPESRPRVQARPLRGVANVIQLAARIRGMQKNANGSS